MDKAQGITAGIIGAGKRGCAFLESLLNSGSVDVQYVVDKDSRALAFSLAKKHGIATLLDIDDALRRYPVQNIFEATGDETVLKRLHEKCPPGTHIINYQVSLFFFDLLNGMRENMNREIVTELVGIKSTLIENSRIIQESSKEVDRVAVNITLLSINASIEASRAGDVGKGFAVVAQAVKETADNARLLSKRIDDVNRESVEAVQKIDTTLNKLTL
jgi:methyl-accepting chemotaxis protein